MKLVLILLALSFSAVSFGAEYNYKCNPLKGSSVTDPIVLSVEKDKAVYKYTDGSGQVCEASYKALTRDGKKAVYDVSGCGADTLLTLSVGLLQGGGPLETGTVGGFARVDNHEEGGYFKSNFICFAPRK